MSLAATHLAQPTGLWDRAPWSTAEQLRRVLAQLDICQTAPKDGRKPSMVYFDRWRNNRDEFARMPRSGKDWAAAAKIGGRKPNAASDSPTRL